MIPLLNVYSQFSFLQAVSSPEELVRAAGDNGCHELALADVNSLHGLVRLVNAARELGVRPLAAARVDVAASGRLLLLSRRDGTMTPLVTAVNRATLRGEAPITCLKGLIVLAGAESRLFSLLAQDKIREAWELAGCWLEQTGPDGLWLAVTVEDRPLWSRVRELAAYLQVGIAACPPVRWVEPHQHLAYQALRGINPGLPDCHAQFPAAGQVEADFVHWPEALAGTWSVAELAGAPLPLGKVWLPSFGAEDQVQLRGLCNQGLRKKYPRSGQEPWARLQRELEVIENMGFSAYFLIAWDLVRFAREQGIAVGPGRGSAGGSIVAYLLDITRVDPLRYNLIFERFLNPGRISLPDIDIDLCYQRREEVFAYAVERYGSEYTCQVSTYSTFGPRGSLRDAGRALGLPRHEIDSLCRQVPGRGTLEQILAQSPRLQALVAQPLWQRWFALAAQLEGRVRHTSVHPGALLITPVALDTLVPLQRARGGDICCQWDKDDVESMGLLKMDLLAVRGLTVNQQVVAQVGGEQLHGFSPRDAATLKLLQQGQTLGCFQLESEGMRGLMRQLHPRGLEDVIAVLSLYRPGPWQAGMVQRYIARRHNKEPVECYHPDLEPVLGDTYGVLLYQEQVMQVAQVIAGYSAGEADSLRRAVAKLRRDKMEELTREFCDRAVRRGYKRELAQRLLQVLVEFSGYAFNRAHSAAYGHLAMATVYLKAHFPGEFLAAILGTRMGYYPMQVYVNEAVRLGLKVLAPCINNSGAGTTGNGDTIQLGLDFVKGLGDGAHRLVAARGALPFQDLGDFAHRCPGRINWQGLVQAGALNCLETNQRQLLAALPTLEGQGSDQGLLSGLAPIPTLPTLPDLEPNQKAAAQCASLGLLLDHQWLARLIPPVALPRITADELERTAAGRRVVLAAAVVNRRQGHITLDDFTGQIEARFNGPVPGRWVWAVGKAGPVLDQVELLPLREVEAR